MSTKRSTIKSVVLMVMMFSLSLMANAGSLLPEIPKAKPGTQCVEDPALMRTSHYDFMNHQRDETMHKGIRTPKHSLKGCIDCHVTKDKNGDYPSISSEKHFCSSCHVYTAVSVDCFQCHATKPDPIKKTK